MFETANHSQLIPMNLQQFGEGDPVDPAPADPGTSDPTPSADPTPSDPAKPVDPPATDPAPLQMFKVKYNKQELEIPYEEAVNHIQKGMNYDKAVERAKQEASQQARDAVIAEMGYEWKGKPITTEAEYRQALQEKALEDKIRSQYSNVPDELMNEILEGRRFREQYQTKEKTAEEKAAKEKMYSEFMEAYPDAKGEEIPPEVWQEVEKGKNLLDAYRAYENKQLKTKLEEFQKGQQVQQANAHNAQTGPGSAKANGQTGTFFTREQVLTMSQEEVYKNYDAIEESRKHW